ncbi:MAG: hypothetical protein H8E90_04090 [Anaerolineales bacterium]|nr:hypothetical protein [Anaerolineales bacterium]
MRKLVAHSRLISLDRVLLRILVVVGLLVVALLLIGMLLWSFEGPEQAGACWPDIGSTAESTNTGIEASRLSQKGTDPIQLCSANWN